MTHNGYMNGKYIWSGHGHTGVLTLSWSVIPCKKLLLSLCQENNASQNTFGVYLHVCSFSPKQRLFASDSKQTERLQWLIFFTSVFPKPYLFLEQYIKFDSSKQSEFLSVGDKMLFFSLCYQIYLYTAKQNSNTTYNFCTGGFDIRNCLAWLGVNCR